MTLMENLSLPFHIKTPLGKAYGLARLEAQALVVEYQWTDRFVGMFRSRIRSVHIPYMALHQVGLQKRWGKTILVLQAQSLMTFRYIPAAAQGFCWLHIQKRDRDMAHHFLDYLQIQLSERQLEQLYKQPLKLPEQELPWSQKLAQLLSRQ